MEMPVDKNAVQMARHRPAVPWLRRTEYISSDVSRVAVVVRPTVDAKMGEAILKDSSMAKYLDKSKTGKYN